MIWGCSMIKRAFLAAQFALAMSSAVVLGLGHSVQAAPVFDTGATQYIGAGADGSDVFGNPAFFQINSIDVAKAGSDLKVIINTVYDPNVAGAQGTGLGDLFIGTNMGNMPTLGAGSATDAGNVAGRFAYVFDISNTTGLGFSGSGGLKALAGGDVGSSAPAGPSIRNGQAVFYTGAGPSITGGGWTLGGGLLTFTITNGATIFAGQSLFLAWAMTCANDVIYGAFVIPPSITEEVPLPAGFILMGSLLLGAGGVARWRRRRNGNLALQAA